jgi:hypothetical protein
MIPVIVIVAVIKFHHGYDGRTELKVLFFYNQFPGDDAFIIEIKRIKIDACA